MNDLFGRIPSATDLHGTRLDRIAAVRKELGHTPSSNHVMKMFGIGRATARQLLVEFDSAPAAEPAGIHVVFDELVDRCAQAAFAADQKHDFNSRTSDRYRSIARAVLVEAMQERS